MTDRPTLLLGVLLLTLLAFGLAAQDLPPTEPEAPEALFDQKIGDVGVVLEADGTWTSHLGLGWGAGFSPQGVLPGLGYPGLEKGAFFAQEPDFSLTLRLFERLYLQLAYHGTVDDRTFLLGYDGREGEAVQWVKAGNASFTVPPRAGQGLAEGRRGTPAAGAAFTLGPVSLEALARYEDGTRETKSYLGYRDLAAATVTLDDWIRQRFFRLPGPYPLTGVKVLVAAPAGTLGGFRAAVGTEAAVDAATGEVRLEASATRRFLVTWSAAASQASYQSPTLKIPVETDASPGANWFVLAQPGSPSAFELRNRYPVATATTGSIVLYDKDKGLPVPGFTVTQSPSQDWFAVSGDEEAPFLDLTGARGGLYPPAYDHGPTPPLASDRTPPGSPSVLPWIFRLPVETKSSSFALGSDVLAGSLVVVRNGLATSAWKFDAAAGTLTFDGPVFETDAIDISFQRRQASGKASDLMLWQGGRWDLAEGHALEWNVQGRWNMDKGAFTTEDLQSPGRMAATLAYEGRAGEWTWSVSATGGALLADSTGHRRLYGQDTAGAQASLDGNALRPSAAPGSLSRGSDGAAFAAVSLTDATRVQAWYRDYWSNDPLTGAPQVSSWDKPGVGRQAGGSGGWTGPYLVRGDGQKTDRLAAVEVDKTAAANAWAGVQVYFDQGKPQDLRATSAVTVNLRIPEGLGSGRVFFQAGTLAEDFDGTRSVRAVEFRSVPALAFFDQHQGVLQYFPIPENSAWGNDAQGDGSAGEDGTLVTRELSTAGGLSAAATGWQQVRLLLTDAERQLLQRTSGWRLVLVPDSGSGTQTLLAGPVAFEGATWSVKADLTQSGSVHPVELADPARTDGHNLRVDWEAARQNWTVEARNASVRPSSYRALAFRYQYAGTPSPTTLLTLTLKDSVGGLTATWPVSAATADWVDAKINFKDGTLTLNGTPAPSASVVVSGGTGPWDRMTVSKVGNDGAGTFLLSEVEAVEPLWEPTGTSAASATWKQSQPWPSPSFPLVSGTTLEVTSSQAGLTADDWSWRGRSALAGTVGPVRASGEASVLRSAAGEAAHGAYEATLPLAWPGGGPRLELTDRFSDLGLRSERVLVSLPWLGAWDAQVTASGPPAQLDQLYRASWTSPSEWPEGWSAAVKGSLAQSLPWSGVLGDFGPLWRDSWAWLPFPSLPAPFALAQAEVSTQAKWSVMALESQETARVTQSSGATVKWSPAGSWSLRVPIKVEGGGWSVAPSASKRAEAVFSEPSAVFPDESAKRALLWLLGQPGGLAAWPFEEQAAAPWSDAGLQSGLVESSVGLDWDRQALTDWTDLVVPSLGAGKLTTVRGVEDSAEYRAAVVSAQLQAQGLNLFGSLGGNPVFPWYRTEVLSWTAAGSWGVGTRVKDNASEVSLATRTDLILTTEESVKLPVTYQGRWGAGEGQSVGLKPTWRLRQSAELPFELPRWLSPKAFHREFVQELSSSLELGWQPAPSPVVRDLQVSWKGRFLLSDKSELSLTTKWGQQWQENLTVVGLEADLALILSF